MFQNAIYYKFRAETRGKKSKITPLVEKKIMRHAKKDHFAISAANKK